MVTRVLRLLLLALALGCGGAHAATVRIATAFDPQTMEPHALALLYHTRVVFQVYDSLVTRDADFRLEPALATEWTMAAPTTWRFRIRQGVAFHDGSPLVADDGGVLDPARAGAAFAAQFPAQGCVSRFNEQFNDRDLQSITPEEILTFLTRLNGDTKQTTKRLRYALLNAFFNLIKNTLDEIIPNPCDTLMLKKIFRSTRGIQWTIFEKETIDEIIFKTGKLRNRLMLELMARGGMRIGEVLSIRSRDVDGRKIILHAPKSGRESEVVFIPQKVADRLKEYIRVNNIDPHQSIFPLTYAGGREVVRRAGKLAGVALKSHDLRRHAATYASRSGTPIEIVSKVILPWPAFPADMMCTAIVVASQAVGSVLIHEKMFESRLYFVDKLIGMGARIVLCDPHRCIVQGPSWLHGERLESPDIRAGMALVSAALCAQGQSIIRNIGQIDRGYEHIEEKLQALGADIVREQD